MEGVETTAGERRMTPDLQELARAEATLIELSRVFFQDAAQTKTSAPALKPTLDARYRVLVEQIPAVLFLAYLEEGISEAYVSPQIEATLGFTQKEWLEDPVRWYRQIHPEDKDRWSTEAAELFLTGKPLRSAYRVLTRAGRVVWFRCEARLVRQSDGRPWFMHGVGFDITDLKRAEEELAEERNLASAILDTAAALVIVTDTRGHIVRFNRACEKTTGYTFDQVQGKRLREFEPVLAELRSGAGEHESHWISKTGERRLISWSGTALTDGRGETTHIIATGIDITERKKLEEAVLEISAREQRRIGQDLHDDLGQLLTGIAFMTRVLQDRLSEARLGEAADAAKIVSLVNEAIRRTRELAAGLQPVIPEARGLMGALERLAADVSRLFGIRCRFETHDAALIHDQAVANQLYRIAQEAVNNAVKHGRASTVLISLPSRGVLSIIDDGTGFDAKLRAPAGLGMHIMRYRARMIGGSLEVHSTPGAGTVIRCLFPVPHPGRKDSNAH